MRWFAYYARMSPNVHNTQIGQNYVYLHSFQTLFCTVYLVCVGTIIDVSCYKTRRRHKPELVLIGQIKQRMYDVCVRKVICLCVYSLQLWKSFFWMNMKTDNRMLLLGRMKLNEPAICEWPSVRDVWQRGDIRVYLWDVFNCKGWNVICYYCKQCLGDRKWLDHYCIKTS